jgi:hypothetical protein
MIKYTSKIEKQTIEEISEMSGLPIEHVKDIYDYQYQVLKQELVKPQYRIIKIDGLGKFWFNRDRLIALLYKLRRTRLYKLYKGYYYKF